MVPLLRVSGRPTPWVLWGPQMLCPAVSPARPLPSLSSGSRDQPPGTICMFLRAPSFVSTASLCKHFLPVQRGCINTPTAHRTGKPLGGIPERASPICSPHGCICFRLRQQGGTSQREFQRRRQSAGNCMSPGQGGQQGWKEAAGPSGKARDLKEDVHSSPVSATYWEDLGAVTPPTSWPAFCSL